MILSSASVVTPGLALAPASSIACAAILPARRIFSICSGVFTSDPVNFAGAGFQTYSGRSIPFGTGRRGETIPAVSVPLESLGMLKVYFARAMLES